MEPCQLVYGAEFLIKPRGAKVLCFTEIGKRQKAEGFYQ